MRIAFDARGINWYKGTGIGTYAENLIKNLILIDKLNKYILYWSGENYEKFKNNNTIIRMASRRYHRFFQEYFFPKDIKKDNIDIYHISQNGIGLSQNINCLKVVTIHDLIPYIMPETVGRGYLLKFLKDMPQIISEADAIITVSEYSKKDILKFFPINPDKVFVTPLAADKIYKPLDKNYCKKYISKKYNINSPFILYLGGFSARKNVSSLIKSYEKVSKDISKDIKLVICGSKKDDIENLIRMKLNSKISENIIFTDFIPNEDLPIFYNSCEVFVYPSLYEGFGLPPLEAMSCGTPVITSNTTSIPEVTGNSALLIDPQNIDMLSEKLYKVLTSDLIKKDLSNKGLKRSLEFSWIKTAQDTLEVYEKIYRESKISSSII
ncbi:putative mannosyltransferase [Clostridium pasteurianum DSM 525 = ATCC 6013]|uniref:Glycosyl transferase group 1 n=1 Tax=Clostridium pasteurianum DSM 525 = ATCC 6013 TaxID=1262449 RepID=A0A0H3J0X6_CLOPA|nr:glycosyltransferase family 1 protein [Clostridium pasteurianum]AJA46337.1 putative mannosyltransferase [Clostridium pasteurianum DSM 525 = ATCC 6013]AJA50325.1 putative mannosyltransferase [Clostridium pasteurianum DSM 525 = ATCC 6013]AOZ73779.1 glycosyl transferase [Clostridium pasteurianum DSM 525 = ATCC 6013]AOZ77576.1 glycosyl transferase [Clostridium pasteurianum]ELP60914.1 mannosyltransferase [Clostridium pasteurianum DSM 525 = ATCC 6013]